MVKKILKYCWLCLFFCLPLLGEEFLLSADEAVRVLATAPPWPTNCAIVSLSGLDKLTIEEQKGWQPGDEDFAQALSFGQAKKERQAELLEIYRNAENNFLEFTRARDDYNYRRYWARYGLYDTPEKPRLEVMDLPEDMPEEFRLFLEGLQRYYCDDLDAARELWERLLELPANRKVYCGNWARTLLAASYSEQDPYKALRGLEDIRKELQKKASPDPKLTACLLRCEASTYAAVTNYTQAMNCHFALNLLGFRNEDIIHHIANLIMQSDGADLTIAVKTPAVAAMTTWHAATLYSNPRLGTLDEVDKEAIARWLSALKREGRLEEVADIASLAAYRIGDEALVEVIYRLAKGFAAYAAWTMAKVKLARNRRQEAESDLAVVYFSFPNLDERLKNALGKELSYLYLSDGRYKESLSLFLATGDWQEAAYIAELVMTSGELERFVKERAAEKNKDEVQETRLRYLLARRLAREGKIRDAVAFFPRVMANNAERIRTALSIGEDLKLSKEERGAARADAARGIYYSGEPLFATENAPDWLSNEGREPRDYGLDRRFQSRLASLSSDEEKRVKLHAQIVPARELCLENAVSQVWLAVELLPNESDELAETLCEAGKWTENREPDVSKRFYEALLERCSSTRLGQEAQATRWFPKGE